MAVGVRKRIRHRRIIGCMHMLMVLVVDVRVIVLQWVVAVLVLVSLGEMQPHSECHQCGRYQKQRRWPLPEDDE